MTRTCSITAAAAILLICAHTAASAVTSTSSLMVDGGDFRKSTFALTAIRGDWFVTPKDASVTLTLSTPPGPSAAKLEIAWNGTAPQHVIDAQANTMVGGEATFFLTLPGANCRPGHDSAVTVRVATLTSLDIDAHLSGSISCEDKPSLVIDGSVRVHRDVAPAPQLSGTYIDCDPTIYDKLIGAEFRSPSECEIKFEADMRRTIYKAFQPVLDSFTANGWILDPLPPAKPITGVGRKLAKDPFRPDFTTNNRLQFHLHLDLSGAEKDRYDKAMADFSVRTGEVLKSLNPAASTQLQKDIERFAHEQAGATKIDIGVNINYPGAGETNFSTEHTVRQQPGTVYAIHMADAQLPTGGASGQDTSYLFLGAWGPPTITKAGAGETLHMAANFNRSISTLAVQNITIRIMANAALADTVMKTIDYTALQSLLHH